MASKRGFASWPTLTVVKQKHLNQQLLKNFPPCAPESVKQGASGREESPGFLQVGVTLAKVAVRFRVSWVDLGAGGAVGPSTVPVPAASLLLFFRL